MSNDEEDLPTTTALTIYRWDCPECGEENELPYGMDFGDEECASCNVTVRVVQG